MANPMSIGAAFFEMTARMMSDPSRLVEAQLSLWNDYMTLRQLRTAQRFGGSAEPILEPPPGDRRFRDKAWTDNTLFDFIKQSYLMTARHIHEAVSSADGLDDRSEQARSNSSPASLSMRCAYQLRRDQPGGTAGDNAKATARTCSRAEEPARDSKKAKDSWRQDDRPAAFAYGQECRYYGG